jgi:hypothetical protein
MSGGRAPALAGAPLEAPGWRRWIPARVAAGQGWIVLVSGVAVLFIALALLSNALGSGPGGPVSSSYATDAKGLAAWAELLGRAGHPVVQLRQSLDSARLDPQSTVVVLDPEALVHSEGIRLIAFVKRGGRLLIGGSEPQNTLPALLTTMPTWQMGGGTRAYPTSGAAQALPGVSEVASAGEGEWQSSGGYRTLLQGAGGALLLARTIGRGELELLADASPLQNRLLASADDAQLGLDLAGGPGRVVVFVESVHGFGESRGLAALPARWWLAFAGLALAGLLWILARARRLGPPEPAETPPSPRGAYVEAIALLLRRTGRTDELSSALTRLRSSALTRLRDRG